MCIYLGIIKLIRIKRQFKSTLDSQKLKFRQISYTLNIIRLQYFDMSQNITSQFRFYTEMGSRHQHIVRACGFYPVRPWAQSQAVVCWYPVLYGRTSLDGTVYGTRQPATHGKWRFKEQSYRSVYHIIRSDVQSILYIK